MQAPELNPAEEHEAEEGEHFIEEETMPVDEDLESADTLDQAAAGAVEKSDGDPNETVANKSEDGSWQ